MPRKDAGPRPPPREGPAGGRRARGPPWTSSSAASPQLQPMPHGGGAPRTHPASGVFRPHSLTSCRPRSHAAILIRPSGLSTAPHRTPQASSMPPGTCEQGTPSAGARGPLPRRRAPAADPKHLPEPVPTPGTAAGRVPRIKLASPGQDASRLRPGRHGSRQPP